jgi:hypothetical protein
LNSQRKTRNKKTRNKNGYLQKQKTKCGYLETKNQMWVSQTEPIRFAKPDRRQKKPKVVTGRKAESVEWVHKASQVYLQYLFPSQKKKGKLNRDPVHLVDVVVDVDGGEKRQRQRRVRAWVCMPVGGGGSGW